MEEKDNITVEYGNEDLKSLLSELIKEKFVEVLNKEKEKREEIYLHLTKI